MNRAEIKIIKRAARNLAQVEREKAEVASPLQLARTIEEWVRIHRQRASDELAAARSLRTTNGGLVKPIVA